MAEVALTGISLGREVDGKFERVEVLAGNKLPTWVSNDDKEILRTNGALGEATPTQKDVEDKDAEIARLKELLAAATANADKKAETVPPSTTPSK
jgi:hypothetical protein